MNTGSSIYNGNIEVVISEIGNTSNRQKIFDADRIYASGDEGLIDTGDDIVGLSPGNYHITFVYDNAPNGVDFIAKGGCTPFATAATGTVYHYRDLTITENTSNPTLTVNTNPNTWTTGEYRTISWSTANAFGCTQVTIELEEIGAGSLYVLERDLSFNGSTGSFSWHVGYDEYDNLIPGIENVDVRFKIYCTPSNAPVGHSGAFQISPVSLFLQSPITVIPTSLIKAENGMIEATVINNGATSWSGALALQLINLSTGASDDIIAPYNGTLSAGQTYTLTRPNGPIDSDPGNYQVRVQYQTANSGDWINVDPGLYENPLPITIYPPGSTLLQLNAPIFVTNPLVHGAPATFSAAVVNNGGNWSGNLAMHILVSGQEIDLDRDDNIIIGTGTVYTDLVHSTGSVGTDPGMYDIFVVYQTDGTGAWEVLDPGNFENPISVTIAPAPGHVTVISPNGGEAFEVGQLLSPINWSFTGNISNVSIELVNAPENQVDSIFVIADGIPNISPYNAYNISACAVGEYKVKIYETNNGPATADLSDNYFSIALDQAAYHIDITSPNGGEVYNAGDPYPTISWTSSGNFGNLSIELVNAQGQTKATIADGIPDASPFVPGPGGIFATNLAAGDYKIKIYNTSCGTVVDESDAFFTINSNYTGVCDCTINDPPSAQVEAYTAAMYLCTHCILDSPAAPASSVNPTDPIIKEDLAKITFLALFGDPATSTYADDFPVPFFDMQNDEPYQRYGKVLSYLEYDDGVSPFDRRFSNYKPGDPITRGQVLKVYAEAFNIPCDATAMPFGDVPNDHPEHKYIAEFAERNLINTNNSSFNPDAPATREAAFIILYRLLALCGDCQDNAITNPMDDTKFFDPGNYTPENLGRHPGFSDGNFDSYSATGFYIASRGMPLVFSHSYNAYLTELPDEFFPVRPLGVGWTHTYHSYIVEIPGYSNTSGIQEDILAVVWPDGTIHAYENNGSTQPPSITEGNYDELTYDAVANAYVIKKKNQVEFRFERIPNANHAPYMLKEIKDRNDNTISLAYQVHLYNDKTLARLYEVTGTTSRKLRFSYLGTSGKIQTVTDLSLGRSIQFYQGYTGNVLDDLIWYKDAEGFQTNYNYVGEHLLQKVTLPNGNFITNNYQEKKLTSSITNNTTTGNMEQTDVDFNLNPGVSPQTTISIYDGVSSQPRDYIYTFNELGKAIQINASTNDADIVYGDPFNPTLPTSITVTGQASTSITTTYTYDERGNVEDVVQAQNTGNEITHHFEYSPINDITLYRNPRGKETTFIYGDGKNLTAVNAPIGTTNITYYPYGLVNTVTNPEGIVASYEYDNHGNVNKVTAPEGIEFTAIYDSGSRLEEFYNPNDQKVTYDYDDRNFITKVTKFLPNHPQYQEVATRYNYDGNGNLTQITNARGYVTQLEYDYFDLLKRETFGTAARQYEYDAEGKLRKITKADGSDLNYDYLDTKGLLESDGYATYGYDNLHRLKTVSKDNKTITFNYDILNRITSTVYDGQTVQYIYDANSNVTRIVYPGGNDVDYTYDDNDRMKTVTDWNGNTTEYFYLDDGRLDHAELPNGVVTEYFYDNAGRVDSLVTKKGSAIICAYGFELDKLGNHTLESKTEPFGYSTLPDINETDYVYNNRNEILSGGGKNFTHDNNGNVKIIAGVRNLTLSWDAHDMLTAVSGDLNATYAYDGLGHRRQAMRNSVTTKYVLDILGMSRILIEQDGNGNAQNYYVYGLGMISRVKPNGDTRYYHYDFRGSTIAMTDETGILTHQYTYDEYGSCLQLQEEDFNPFRFVGGFGVMQEDSTLLFMRARYYEASIGRFLSKDPIWSDNLYAYGGGNPVNYSDPGGEEAKNVEKFQNGLLTVAGGVVAIGGVIVAIGGAPVTLPVAIGISIFAAGGAYSTIAGTVNSIDGYLNEPEAAMVDMAEDPGGLVGGLCGENGEAIGSTIYSLASLGFGGFPKGAIDAVGAGMDIANIITQISKIEPGEPFHEFSSPINYPNDIIGPGSIVGNPAPLDLPKQPPVMDEYKPHKVKNYTMTPFGPIIHSN
ncbi:MAG: S-layer homology domain-containing protein [Lewinellaceae bacterium]|nr:S-layer homology domain-containing protein [Lewinellaceae bacterium]